MTICRRQRRWIDIRCTLFALTFLPKLIHEHGLAAIAGQLVIFFCRNPSWSIFVPNMKFMSWTAPELWRGSQNSKCRSCNPSWPPLTWFLPCCMKCRRSLQIRILSVRLSVKRVNCDKMEERSVQIFIPYERSFSLVFWEEEWLVGGDHFYLKFCLPAPIRVKSPIFNRYSRLSRNTWQKKFN